MDENGRMKTRQSRTPVSFGCRAEDQLVTVGEGENALSFDLIGQQVSAPVEAPAVQAAEPQTGLSQQPAGRLENQVTYQNILESTDLTYDISADRLKAVSYTHLTLPTNREVGNSGENRSLQKTKK